MGYLIFRSVSTQSLNGVYVSKMPNHKKAAMRNTEYYVKGRDGALHVDEGLSNFDITATLVLVNGSAGARQQVNAWADGTGKLITSDNLGFAYRASVKEEIVWQRVPGNIVNGQLTFYDTAQITWTCEPYMYEAIDTVITLTEGAFVVNPGSAPALPFIQVNGSGDVSFMVNGEEITIEGMTAGTPVNIDCENGYVYTAQGATSMTGDFPEFTYGENTVSLETGVTSLVITPHWRWI